MRHKVDCLICGAELLYQSEPAQSDCYFCGEAYQSDVKCANGHFICDQCHSSPANALIHRYCIDSESADSLEMAVSLMRDSQVAMHGPEHHFLVPAVLLSAYYNVTNQPAEKERKIGIARKRASNVLGGFCGFYGNCGAAVGTGIFISLITGANPLSIREWQLSNLATARSLLTIANLGGPRCCKRNSFLAIKEATEFLHEHFNITLPVSEELDCEFSPLNKECITEDCPFYAQTPP